MRQISLFAIPDLPEFRPGDDPAALLRAAIDRAGLRPAPGDVLAIAQKIISKAEGRLVDLHTVTAGPRALEVAAETGQDPRLVELILSESQEISRLGPGVLIARHRLGYVCANAGIDRSNVPQTSAARDTVLLLPEDPDRSARRLRQELLAQYGVEIGVVITDSHGRPHRVGSQGIAIGVAGLLPVWDRRGDTDRQGYTLRTTQIGLADEIAAAASLLMGQADEGTPAVLLRGLDLPAGDGQIGDLIRPLEQDLYR